jgi:hypothetical protein
MGNNQSKIQRKFNESVDTGGSNAIIDSKELSTRGIERKRKESQVRESGIQDAGLSRLHELSQRNTSEDVLEELVLHTDNRIAKRRRGKVVSGKTIRLLAINDTDGRSPQERMIQVLANRIEAAEQMSLQLTQD